MNLDEKISSFLATVDTVPARSKLEPYTELIRSLRQRRWTYLRISKALYDQFGLNVHPTTVHAFVKVRSGKGKGVLTMSTPLKAPVLEDEPATVGKTGRRRFNLDA